MNAPPLQYRLLKRLYQGRCSTVSRVLLPGRDAPVIVKQLDRGRCAPGAPARLQHEFELLGTLEHLIVRHHLGDQAPVEGLCGAQHSVLQHELHRAALTDRPGEQRRNREIRGQSELRVDAADL